MVVITLDGRFIQLGSIENSSDRPKDGHSLDVLVATK